MKDIVITSKRMKAELIVLLSCFAVALLVNLYAIIKYHTPWTEFFSQIGFVVILTAIIYIIHWVIRILVWLCSLIVRKIGKRQ